MLLGLGETGFGDACETHAHRFLVFEGIRNAQMFGKLTLAYVTLQRIGYSSVMEGLTENHPDYPS